MFRSFCNLYGCSSFRNAFFVSATFLVLFDFLLIGTHVIVHLVRAGTDAGVPRQWAITQDGSYGEIFTYLKFMLTAGLMGVLWRRHRAVMYLAWAAVFAILLLDDMLQMHERGGAFLAGAWNLGEIWGMRAAAFTSMIIMALLGAVIAVLVVSGFLLSPRRHHPTGYLMLGVMGGMIFCGVVVDFLAVAAETLDSGILLGGLGTLEDGGEMVFASLGTALAIGFWRTEALTEDRRGFRPEAAAKPVAVRTR